MHTSRKDVTNFRLKGRFDLNKYRFVQLDVFTDLPFSGNPLAVFPEAEGLTDVQLLQIAREMNLSETVFVLPPQDKRALRRLRIFTPTRELPMAGHPVVGTWNALAREGVVPLPDGGNGWTRIEHELGIGVLPVDIEFKDGLPVQVVMTQGNFTIISEIEDPGDHAELARALGLATEALDVRLPIQIASTGVPILLVPIRTIDDLKSCHVNTGLLTEVGHRIGISECYAFTRETLDGVPSCAHARLFAPEFGISEDPATGGAAGPLTAYLVHHDALEIEPGDGTYRFVIEQGDFMNRSSRINVEITGEVGRIGPVRVGGPSVVVAHGELVF